MLSGAREPGRRDWPWLSRAMGRLVHEHPAAAVRRIRAGGERAGVVQSPAMAPRGAGHARARTTVAFPVSLVPLRLEHLRHLFGAGADGCGIGLGSGVAGEPALRRCGRTFAPATGKLKRRHRHESQHH